MAHFSLFIPRRSKVWIFQPLDALTYDIYEVDPYQLPRFWDAHRSNYFAGTPRRQAGMSGRSKWQRGRYTTCVLKALECSGIIVPRSSRRPCVSVFFPHGGLSSPDRADTMIAVLLEHPPAKSAFPCVFRNPQTALRFTTLQIRRQVHGGGVEHLLSETTVHGGCEGEENPEFQRTFVIPKWPEYTH